MSLDVIFTIFGVVLTIFGVKYYGWQGAPIAGAVNYLIYSIVCIFLLANESKRFKCV